ncbi:MAG: glycosyltransferase family 2 protein, partial [Halobacteriota archaeon]
RESNNLNLSVIIPTYNRAGMICRAIDSVIPQLTVGDEIIVIDDGSTDGTEESLKEVRDKITYRRISHGGAGRARNEGIAIAHNGLIAFLDSDDEWMPKKIELQRALLQARPDVLFCFSDWFKRDLDSDQHPVSHLIHLDKDQSFGEHILGPGIPFSSIAPLPEGMDDFMVHFGDLYGKQMERECVSVITLTYRRGSEHEGDLKYPEDLPTREDWEFVGKLARKGLAAYLDCETAIAYQHSGPELVKLDDLTHLNARIKLLERVWGADIEYLKDHREQYLRVDHVLHKSLVREFLRLGRMQEAREEIRKNANIPMTYKLLSRFPGFVNRSLFRSPLPGFAYWSRSQLKKKF